MSYGFTFYDPDRTLSQFISEASEALMSGGSSAANTVQSTVSQGASALMSLTDETVPWATGMFKGGGGYVYRFTENTVQIISGPTGVGTTFSRASDTAQKIARELASLGWPKGQPPATPAIRSEVLDQKGEKFQPSTFFSANPWVLPAAGVGVVGLAIVGYMVMRRRA